MKVSVNATQHCTRPLWHLFKRSLSHWKTLNATKTTYTQPNLEAQTSFSCRKKAQSALQNSQIHQPLNVAHTWTKLRTGRHPVSELHETRRRLIWWTYNVHAQSCMHNVHVHVLVRQNMQQQLCRCVPTSPTRPLAVSKYRYGWGGQSEALWLTAFLLPPNTGLAAALVTLCKHTHTTVHTHNINVNATANKSL